MITSKIIVIVVAALFVGGAAAAVVFWPENEGGWDEWDPVIGQVDYSLISTTPRIVEVVENMYEFVYGDLPEKRTAPAGWREFEPLVVPTNDGIKIKGPAGVSEFVEFTQNEIDNMKVISYGRGFTDTYVSMLGDEVWDTVVAAGGSTWTNYPNNGMAHTTSLGSEMTFGTEGFDRLNSFLNDDKSTPYCVIVWGYTSLDSINGLRSSLSGAGYTNVKILVIDYYAMNSWEYFLSVMDALGQLIGVSTANNDAMSDFRDRLYTIEDAVTTTGMKVYMETGTGTSPGANTLTQLCFDSLGLDNINKTTGTNALDDELIITSEPDVIFYIKGDDKVEQRKARLGL